MLTSEIESRFKDTATIKELGRWSVVDTWYASGGLQAVAFKIDSNIVVTYRGSDEGVDWFNNATTYVLGISTHTAGAKKFIKKVMSAYEGYDVYVTGHSLGGHLAYNAAAEGIHYSKSSIKGVVTFNGLGLTLGLTLFGDLWDEAQLQKKPEVIRNYSVEVLYYTVFELLPAKKSPGYLFLGIQLCCDRTSKFGLRIWIRNILKVFSRYAYGIPFFALIFSKNGKTLYDFVTKMSVKTISLDE